MHVPAPLVLSKIFDWYKTDFGGDAGLREFVKKGIEAPSMKQALASAQSVKIAFMEYDWTINAIERAKAYRYLDCSVARYTG